MKAYLSPLIKEISGPLGPCSIFQSLRQTIVRTRGIGQPNPSAALSAVHAAYGRLFEYYPLISSIARATWPIAGDRDAISYWNSFIKANLTKELAGDPFYHWAWSSDFPSPPNLTFSTPNGPKLIGVHWTPVDTGHTYTIAMSYRETGTKTFGSFLAAAAWAVTGIAYFTMPKAATMYDLTVGFRQTSTNKLTVPALAQRTSHA